MELSSSTHPLHFLFFKIPMCLFLMETSSCHMWCLEYLVFDHVEFFDSRDATFLEMDSPSRACLHFVMVRACPLYYLITTWSNIHIMHICRFMNAMWTHFNLIPRVKSYYSVFHTPHIGSHIQETCFSPLGLSPFYKRVIPCERNSLQVMGDFGRIDIPMCYILVKTIILSIINQLYSIVILLKWRRAHLLWISKDINSWSN